jgi:transposase-like protein
MAMTVGRFRRQVAQRRGERERGAPRYPQQMRDFAVAHARAVRAGGGSVSSAARELGISEMTLSSWLRAARGPGRLREVRVRPEPAGPRTPPSAPSLEVMAPSGHVVRGLSVQQAAELLRALS